MQRNRGDYPTGGSSYQNNFTSYQPRQNRYTNYSSGGYNNRYNQSDNYQGYGNTDSFNPWKNPNLYIEAGITSKIQYYYGYHINPKWSELYDTSTNSAFKVRSRTFQETQQTSSGHGPRCKLCNDTGHLAKNCPDQLCTKCQGKGHNGRDCPEHKRGRLSEGQNDTIYIQGLPKTITEDEIQKHFSQVGRIRMKRGKFRDEIIPQIHIYRDKNSNEVKGDCTVSYDDPEAAPSAVKRYHGAVYQGCTLVVTLAEKKSNAFDGKSDNFDSRGGFDNRGGYDNNRGGFDNRHSGGFNRNFDNSNNWTCPRCSSNNFNRRPYCFSCRAPMPHDALPQDNSRRDRDYNRSH